jgi:hypothetical protein
MRGSAVLGYGYRYRRWVLDSLKYVDGRDLATGGDHIPELADVFVDVALVSRASRQHNGDQPGRPAEAALRGSLSELLDRRERAVLVLVGQPGSGKSTLLAHAARRAARAGMPWRMAQRRIPVLLALREHAGSIAADLTISLPTVIRAAVTAGGAAGREPVGWWERQLRRGRCMVLLDGLDEIAGADERRAVAEWIGGQIAAYPGCHFVVTSRSYALPDPLPSVADVVVVRPFTAEQVRLFLDRWSMAAERHATGDSGPAVRLRAEESTARLTTLLGRNPALQDLAVNPLLLTMIATAHRYRGALPDGRADLYGEMCQVLLARRSQVKNLPELMSWPAKQALLAALAFQMMCEHVSALPADRVAEILGSALERFPASVTAEAFLDDVSRGGLLTEAPGGRYSFTHLTFQEYLAARHVGANPDLVKRLADNVDESWWHETIALYAATADVSPIIRACLDSGTISALTLAFDCAGASTEMDPELRRRLNGVRRRAYELDCPPEHRRLIAGVRAARLVRHTLSTASGIRICAQPVSADLYWLFLTDTQAPRPDSPCEPRSGQPVTGVWGTDAQSFVRWLNSITATTTGVEVRLPRAEELQEERITEVLRVELADAVTSSWTAPPPGLWLRPGQPHPHELTGAAIRQAAADDARNASLLPQILTASVLGVAFDVVRALDDVRALTADLASDLNARANSDERAAGLMQAHAHAIAHTYAHARARTRAPVITGTRALAPELVDALGLAPARALADAVANDLSVAIGVARGSALELADTIDLDASLLSTFNSDAQFDLQHARELARVHATDLERADALARGIPDAPGLGLARLFGLSDGHALHPALPLPGFLGLPLRWVVEGPFASTLLQVLASTPTAGASPLPQPDASYQAFAHALASRAGISETSTLRADLGSPLTEALREATAALSRPDGVASWHQVTGLRQLADSCAPTCDTHKPPSQVEAAGLRAVALALADSAAATGSDAAEVLRTVAATVTVVEQRGRGKSAHGESILLALV